MKQDSENGGDVVCPDEEASPIEDWYAELERVYDIGSHIEDLDHLCDAAQNQSVPIHSWFNLKEAFSFEFPGWIVQYLANKYNFHPVSVIDPFCGGGTTVITLARRGLHATGIEYNPFIAWLAKTKSMWWAYDLEELQSTFGELQCKIQTSIPMKWPALSTFKNADYFRPRDIDTLLYTLQLIAELHTSISTKHFLRIGVAAAIDDVGNLRKDGRALRYVQKVSRPSARAAVLNHWTQNIAELKKLYEQHARCPITKPQVWRGNALNLKVMKDPWDDESQDGLADLSYDLVLYSPPYLNNFDYSEVYKLELWLLGFIQNYDQWKELRRGTLRSHHSIKFERLLHLNTNPATREIYKNLQSMGESDALEGYAKENMPSVILGYFDDMHTALEEQFRILRPGGFLVYMVANSRHAELPIATDVVIGEVARTVGFKQLELLVFHKRNGRTRKKRFLRESAIVLQKPFGPAT